MTIVLTILLYFAALYVFSLVVGGRKTDTNDTFFRGNKRSPWYMVAFGMVGASISGVTFISVPGMVMKMDMTYLQTCIGFILGYVAVAFVLLPVYYRNNLTTIYSYLDTRLGTEAYKTGAWFFLLSKMTGAAVRFYVVCMILHDFVLAATGIPFWTTTLVMILLIWLYTFRGGIRTLVWTDTFQTTCLIVALLLIIYNVTQALGMDIHTAWEAVAGSDMSRVWEFDPISRQYFWKQFLSGIFIVIVMTGLDQDMMQKNLTCKSLREAQKDMCTYGLAFVPVNALFLGLGVLLVMLAGKEGVDLPVQGDMLLPMFTASGSMGETVMVLFTIGVVAASFSSADSALTALTTSFCVDIIGKSEDVRIRRCVHLSLCVIFFVLILLFSAVNTTSVIDAIYTICSYTYGPLLGLFAYALLTKRKPWGRAVAWIALASPLLCYAIDRGASEIWDYHFGYELLMLNGLLTFTGLHFSRYIQKVAFQTPS